MNFLIVFLLKANKNPFDQHLIIKLVRCDEHTINQCKNKLSPKKFINQENFGSLTNEYDSNQSDPSIIVKLEKCNEDTIEVTVKINY